jgi:hypothetical protein
VKVPLEDKVRNLNEEGEDTISLRAIGAGGRRPTAGKASEKAT